MCRGHGSRIQSAPTGRVVTARAPRRLIAGRARRWSSWAVSVGLHGVLLGSMYSTAATARRPNDAESSPFGGQSDPSSRAVSAWEARRAGPALETIPVEIDSVELDPPSLGVSEEPSPEPPPPRAEADVERPRRAPEIRAPKPLPPAAPPPRLAAPASARAAPTPYTEGEDWLGIEQELDSPEPASQPPVASGEGRSGPEPETSTERQSAGTALERDPLLERLMAAEARKARQRRPPARTAASTPLPPAPLAQPSAPPRTSSVAERALAGVSDVPVGLARWLSVQAHAGEGWDRIALGRTHADVTLRLQDARVVEAQVGASAPRELRSALQAAFHHLRRHDFPGGTVHDSTGVLRLVVDVQVTRLPREGQTGLNHSTTADGRYLPSAYVLRPSARRIDLEVRLLP